MQFRTPSSPPTISAVNSGIKRPLWSVMIPVYNCSQYLPETLTSVLSQALAEKDMQIEVVDDASTDADVAALVLRIGKGRINYYRQEENVGSLRNFETCINRSNGHLIHLLHGDDRITPSFYSKFSELFKQFPDAGAAHCRFRYLSEDGQWLYNQNLEMEHEGILENWLPRVAVRNLSQYVATVVKREVYEKVGGFYAVTYGEDWEMWVRIAKIFPVAYTPELLAEYRKHNNSISSNSFLTGQNSKDLLTVMQLIQHHLPSELRKPVLQASKKFYSHYGMRMAHQVWKNAKNKNGVQAQIKYAWSMYIDSYVLWETTKLYIKLTLNIA